MPSQRCLVPAAQPAEPTGSQTGAQARAAEAGAESAATSQAAQAAKRRGAAGTAQGAKARRREGAQTAGAGTETAQAAQAAELRVAGFERRRADAASRGTTERRETAGESTKTTAGTRTTKRRETAGETTETASSARSKTRWEGAGQTAEAAASAAGQAELGVARLERRCGGLQADELTPGARADGILDEGCRRARVGAVAQVAGCAGRCVAPGGDTGGATAQAGAADGVALFVNVLARPPYAKSENVCKKRRARSYRSAKSLKLGGRNAIQLLALERIAKGDGTRNARSLAAQLGRRVVDQHGALAVARQDELRVRALGEPRVGQVGHGRRARAARAHALRHDACRVGRILDALFGLVC